MINVELTQREMAMGAHTGVMRNITAMADKRRDNHGFDDEHGWNVHIEGACGEIAAAKAMDRFWSPTVNVFSAPDLGRRIQVRTRSRHDYDLIIRPDDDPAHYYVLITGRAPSFIARGYILGADARDDRWVKDYGGRPPAWFVPQAALLDINDLKKGRE